VIAEIVILLGAVLILLSAIGVVRFDDVLARLHALAKATTLGILIVLVGAAIALHSVYDTTSILLAALLHLLVSPPASNMLSRATYLSTGLPDGRVDECQQERSQHEARRD
jgi:multicomponent Na+:H+ antiporter subunit G